MQRKAAPAFRLVDVSQELQMSGAVWGLRGSAMGAPEQGRGGDREGSDRASLPMWGAGEEPQARD